MSTSSINVLALSSVSQVSAISLSHQRMMREE